MDAFMVDVRVRVSRCTRAGPLTRDEIHLEHVLPLFASWRGDVGVERIIIFFSLRE